MVCAVVVTHRRPEELATSLKVVTGQSRMIDHLIVVDNDFGHDEGDTRVGSRAERYRAER